jgi:hypothetical protein
VKKPVPIELPIVVSVRFSETDFNRILQLAQAGRRNVSQQIRLLLEGVVRDSAAAAKTLCTLSATQPERRHMFTPSQLELNNHDSK